MQEFFALYEVSDSSIPIHTAHILLLQPDLLTHYEPISALEALIARSSQRQWNLEQLDVVPTLNIG